MATNNHETLISAVKLSSVVPATVTGENTVHELTDIDIAMKLHYIKGVYFFSSDSVRDLKISDLKTPMFKLLDLYFAASGRIRFSDSGRPFIKCNDGGIRIIEAHCEKSVDEWLEMADHCVFDSLVYDQVIGPDLDFSPLIYIQFTWFKCGGICVGLNWSHILGDIFSASTFINTWGKILAGHVPPKSLHVPNLGEPVFSKNPQFLKRVDTIKNCWLSSSTCKMVTYNFRISEKLLEDVVSNNSSLSHMIAKSCFEVISAILWKCLAQIKNDSGCDIVTICTNNYSDMEKSCLINGFVSNVVQTDFSIAKSDISKLAGLIAEKIKNENNTIKNFIETDHEKSDFIVYGANLTFINLEKTNIYGLEINGNKPVFANYTIDGVGDKGVVMVFPNVKDRDGNETSSGYTVGVLLPENQLAELKNVMNKVWLA